MKIAGVFLGFCIACGATTNVKRAVIDCTVQSRPQIEALLLEFRQLLVGEAPNWQAVLTRAIAAGETIGGCALAELVQERKTKTEAVSTRSLTAPAPDEGKKTLEQFREEHARGATFRTPKGDM